MFRFLPILATLILCGCGPNETSMDAHKPIADKMRLASNIDVYEGVPRRRVSGNLFPWEREAEGTTKKFGEYEFHKLPLDVSAEDKEALSRLFSDVTLVRPLDLTPSSCVGFHPEYCFVWKTGSDTYHVMLSLESGEIEAAGGGLGLSMEFDNGSEEKFGTILEPYRRHAAEHEEEEVSTTVEPAFFP